MNELVIKGNQEFLGISIPVVEGGFGEGKRCILVKDIAVLHQVDLKRVNEVIRNNIDEFEKEVDIIDLKSDVSNDPLFELGFTKEDIRKANNIYLLSESGYMTLCMFMRTKIAKEKRQQFKKEYFAMREVIQSQLNLKEQMLLKLFSNDPMEVATAHKQLLVLETKPLIDKIEEQRPMVDMCLKRRSSDGLVTFTDIQHTYGLKQGQLGTWLRNNGYIHKTRQEVCKIADGLLQVYGEQYPSIGITTEGVKFIDDNIEKIKESPCRLSKKEVA